MLHISKITQYKADISFPRPIFLKCFKTLNLENSFVENSLKSSTNRLLKPKTWSLAHQISY